MVDLFSLKGKNAVCIGGSKGLGKGMATGLASRGAHVILVSRKQNELDEAAADIAKETGANVIGIAGDISSLEGIKTLVDKVVAECGQIDILINGAGVNKRGPALEFTEEMWDTVQDVQLKYVFFMCQAVAKHMIEKGVKGKIINIASLTTQLGLPNLISYAGAKGAIGQISKSMANEWAQYGINVNCIGPGYYYTAMTAPLFDGNPEYKAKLLSRIPMGRFGNPEDLAGAAAFLACPASDYVTGQILYVDGGFLCC